MSGGRRALFRRAPAFLYVAGVFYGGVIDVGPLPELPALSADKVLHALAFLGLGLLIELALYELPPVRRRILAVVLSAGAGGLLELVQATLPYRSADIWDFVADALGALTSALVSWLVFRITSRSPRASAGAR